jgi:LmbE family N-acetylglucosaminyl deacetylase
MSCTGLPDWGSVLAIVAHPDDESFGLGALLSAFVDAGAQVSVLCFTRGEASTLHGVDGDLATIRAEELRAAARELGITDVHLKAYPDGGLADVDFEGLMSDANEVATRVRVDGLLAFDVSGVSGHPDHQRATDVAAKLAADRGIGLLGWTLTADIARALNDERGSAFTGHRPEAQRRDLPPQSGDPGQRPVAAAGAAGRPRIPALAAPAGTGLALNVS